MFIYGKFSDHQAISLQVDHSMQPTHGFCQKFSMLQIQVSRITYTRSIWNQYDPVKEKIASKVWIFNLTLSVPTYRFLCVAQEGGYIVLPKIISILAPKRARELMFQCVVHLFYISCLKKEFLKSVEKEASGQKNAFKDFFWLRFCFCKYEGIFSPRDLKFDRHVYFHTRNKKRYC